MLLPINVRASESAETLALSQIQNFFQNKFNSQTELNPQSEIIADEEVFTLEVGFITPVAAYAAYQEYVPPPPPSPPPRRIQAVVQTADQQTLTVVNGAYPCSCVMYAYSRTGNEKVRGYGLARNIPITSKEPALGAIVKTTESWAGHVGVVTAIENGYIVIDEANFRRCQVTTGRKLPLTSPLILGYIH